MKMSQLFTRTLREAPADEVAKNAQLLIRAGYIHKEMAGVYAYLPLGYRVIENLKKIISDEMNAIGGQEVMMTVLQPRELWEKTDRWDDAKVDNWFKTKLFNGTEVGVGLTHEEPLVDALAPYMNSYKDLPILAYQMQSKFRNEKRAKSGILRGREFLMKDMYSFSRSQSQHDEVYERIAMAYMKIYSRVGLGGITFRVKADGGIFTERFSDEFQTITPVGEDTLFHVPGTDEYYNGEVAPSRAPEPEQEDTQHERVEVNDVSIVGVDDLAKHFGHGAEKTTKTMFYDVEGQLVAAVVRGTHNINEIKLRKALGVKHLMLASPDLIKNTTRAEIGFAGLVDLPDSVRVIIDDSCEHMTNFETGGNKTGVHYGNVNWERDVKRPEQFYDIKEVREGDRHPGTGKLYEIFRSVEVGNIFPLETKYTEALGVKYVDEEGQRQPIIMGSYGLGISRLMGVLAEHFSDEKGLVWSDEVAPFRVHLVAIGDVATEAQALYDELHAKGIEVLWDDRDERAGAKFADADLIGIPHRVVVSEKHIKTQMYEYKKRTETDAQILTRDQLFAML